VKSEDGAPRALSPSRRRVAHAFAAALLAVPEAERERLDRLVDQFDAHLAAVSPSLRVGLLVALEWIRWLPFALLVAWRPFDELSTTERTKLLERMDRSSSPLLFLPLVAYKTLLSMIHFESPRELLALGYPGDERTRWKRVA
jgi:hypothetical protein